jgi:hypothetical protein
MICSGSSITRPCLSEQQGFKRNRKVRQYHLNGTSQRESPALRSPMNIYRRTRHIRYPTSIPTTFLTWVPIHWRRDRGIGAGDALYKAFPKLGVSGREELARYAS